MKTENTITDARIQKMVVMSVKERLMAKKVCKKDNDLFLVETKITRIDGSPIEFLMGGLKKESKEVSKYD